MHRRRGAGGNQRQLTTVAQRQAPPAYATQPPSGARANRPTATDPAAATAEQLLSLERHGVSGVLPRNLGLLEVRGEHVIAW
jgi:hypothetical protein